MKLLVTHFDSRLNARAKLTGVASRWPGNGGEAKSTNQKDPLPASDFPASQYSLQIPSIIVSILHTSQRTAGG